jgi:hypothetical protein
MPIVITDLKNAGMMLLLLSSRVRRRSPPAQTVTYIRSALPMPERLASLGAA